MVMKTASSLFSAAAFTFATFASSGALAQAASAPPTSSDAKNSSTAVGDMTEGEVRKVDMETKKITLKHGEIKSLGMPGMTMVFQVKDPTMLDALKAGDKVKFNAERAGGALVVTHIETVK